MSDCRRPSYATVNGAWWDLAEAVILQAVKDYRRALYHPEKYWYQIEKIEEFFRSDWFALLSDGLNPDELIRRIKQMSKKVSKTGQLVQPHNSFGKHKNKKGR